MWGRREREGRIAVGKGAIMYTKKGTGRTGGGKGATDGYFTGSEAGMSSPMDLADERRGGTEGRGGT